MNAFTHFWTGDKVKKSEEKLKCSASVEQAGEVTW